MGGVKSGHGWSHEWAWAGSHAGVGETKGPDRNTDWVCGLKTVPDAALIRSGSPVRCVFKRVNDKTQTICTSVQLHGRKWRVVCVCVCVYLYTSSCEYCISLCICIPHVL